MPPFLEGQLQMERSTKAGLHLRRIPGDSRSTLFYIHGLGESGLCFERVMADPRLAAWHQIAVDLPGYGKSDWTSAPFSLEQHAECVAELIARLDLDSVVLLGHSMGGVIGTHLGKILDKTLRGFIDVEGNISLGDCGFSSRAAAYPMAEWLETGFDRVVDAIGRQTDDTWDVRAAYIASILICDPRVYHRNSIDLVQASTTETLAQQLSELEAPVVYIHGAPRGTGARSLELLDEAGIERIGIGDTGHWPFLERRSAFVDAMVDFLARI